MNTLYGRCERVSLSRENQWLGTKTQIGKISNLDWWSEGINLADLANSCEYLTSEKLCLAVSESEKAKASRQVRCRNDEKMTCCYLCMFVLDCASPCRFLGNSENEPQQIDQEKTSINNSAVSKQKPEEDKTKNALVNYCSACNVEMSRTRTKLTIDGWKGSHQKSADNESLQLGKEELPVIVYLCPICGKIDLKAEEKINKN